jgi:amino-acid N-acetyltransferase
MSPETDPRPGAPLSAPSGNGRAAMAPILLRRARTADVRGIKSLVDGFASDNILLRKPLVTLYETVQEFRVAVRGREVVGCGALHVLWENLGEVRTIAVHPSVQGGGLGHTLVDELIAQARALGLASVFVLTFEVDFFARHGFREIDGSPVSQEIYLEMMQSADEGVAEFLDLAYVKPNTLGNTRMLLDL